MYSIFIYHIIVLVLVLNKDQSLYSIKYLDIKIYNFYLLIHLILEILGVLNSTKTLYYILYKLTFDKFRLIIDLKNNDYIEYLSSV